eukprot:scpid51701/ scgid7154/ Hypoxia-inducible factor 1-alpha inhibitor; Hypoxia-inducible factor asparagine hydroxylase
MMRRKGTFGRDLHQRSGTLDVLSRHRLYALSIALLLLWLSGIVQYLLTAVLLRFGYFGIAVERVSFPTKFESYRHVAEARHPVILTNNVANQWRARKLWTPAYLSRVVKHGSVHSQKFNPVFKTFHDNRSLESLITERWADYNTKSKKSIAQVLKTASDTYHYYSEEINTVMKSYPDALDDIQPLSELVLTPEDVQINVWIGRPGIVTHTHYDATYNFFVQLRGRKRFTLFPPSSEMYLYPCLHPHYGHTQVNVYNWNRTLYPNFDRSKAMIADLRAGDMLFVPPFWYHHVETMAESVSVNVWSIAEELTIMDEIYKKAVPFEETWDVATMISACRVYFQMIAEEIQVFFEAVWKSVAEQRYRPLVESSQLHVPYLLDKDMRAICKEMDVPSLTARWEEKFSRGVQNVAPHFLQITDFAVRSRSVRSLCLGNYMEHIVASVLPTDHIAPFFLNCLVKR